MEYMQEFTVSVRDFKRVLRSSREFRYFFKLFQEFSSRFFTWNPDFFTEWNVFQVFSKKRENNASLAYHWHTTYQSWHTNLVHQMAYQYWHANIGIPFGMPTIGIPDTLWHTNGMPILACQPLVRSFPQRANWHANTKSCKNWHTNWHTNGIPFGDLAHQWYTDCIPFGIPFWHANGLYSYWFTLRWPPWFCKKVQYWSKLLEIIEIEPFFRMQLFENRDFLVSRLADGSSRCVLDNFLKIVIFQKLGLRMSTFWKS